MLTLSDDIVTPRLLLRLMNQEVLTACLAGDLTHAGQLLGAVIPEELLEHPSGLRYNQQQLDTDPKYPPWSARAIILPDEALMIGVIRFHTSPDPAYLHPYTRNAVEFGYEIFTPFRRQHYATEAVKAVMNWAQSTFGIDRFVASVSPENTPSLQLITRLGFHKVGEVMDETDGMEHVFLHIVH